MANVILGIIIVILLFYLFVLIDTIILVKKYGKKRLIEIRDMLIKRINLAMILTILLVGLIIARILILR